MLKKPIPSTKIYTGTPQDQAGFNFSDGGKRIREINVGFKQHQDDCPANAIIYHLVNENIWAYIETIAAD